MTYVHIFLTYTSKSESEKLESLKQAARKTIYSFISTRRLSVQEAVYNVLTELWLRKFFQEFLSSVRICQKIVLSEDGTNMYE